MKKVYFVCCLLVSFISFGQVANQPDDIESCDDAIADGFTIFDLTITIPEILGGQNPTDFNITYYETLADAQAGGPFAIASPTTYINISNPQQIFARLESVINGNFDITDFALIVLPLPSPATPTPLEVCDDDGDGIAPFNLATKDMEIADGDPDLIISYHETEVDAQFGVNPLIDPYVNIVPSFQVIYARAESITTLCASVVPLELVVLDGCPTVIDEPDNVFIDEGDGDGEATFDLTVNEAQMLGPQDPTIFLFSYHLSDLDARTNQNAITDPEMYTNTENPQEIFIRFYNNTENGYVVSSFEIETDGVLDLGDFENKLDFILFPNPSQVEVYIITSSLEPIAITLYSLNGSLLNQFDATPSSEGIRLDTSHLTSGMYFVSVTSKAATQTKKLLVK